MANQPEREIERQLKAAAQLRRDAAGPPRAMPPAMRQKLQNEVARLQPAKKSRAGFWSQLFVFTWPRLAIATACILVLGLLLSRFIPGSPQTPGTSTLALNAFKPADRFSSQTDAEKVAPSAPSPAAPSSAIEIPAPAKLDGLADESKFKAPALNTPLATPPPAIIAKDNSDQAEASRDISVSRSRELASTVQPLRRKGGESNKIDETFGSAASPALASDDLKTAAPRGQAATFDSPVYANTNALTQSYAQINGNSTQWQRKQPGGSVVLNSFQLQQTGNQIRVIDRDGSIYSGAIEPASDLADTGATLAYAGNRKAQEAVKKSRQATEGLQPGAAIPAVTTAAPPRVAQNYSFRVSGTNRTLQQLVVFTGRLENTLLTTPAGATAPASAVVLGGVAKKVTGNLQSPASNLRLSGHAIIGTTNQLDILAEPVKP